jgi:hypothetical protein
MTTTKTPGALLDEAIKDADTVDPNAVETFITVMNLGPILAKIQDGQLTVDQAKDLVTDKAGRDALQTKLNKANAKLAAANEILRKCRKVLARSGIYNMDDYKDNHLPRNLTELSNHYVATSTEDTDPDGTPQTNWRIRLSGVGRAFTGS